MKNILSYLLLLCFLLCSSTLQAQFKNSQEKADKSLERAANAFEDLTQMEDKSIPKALLERAEGIVIFPGALKVALGVGGQGGRGIAIVRKDDGSWSNPFFIGMGEGNIGAQVGVQSADIILLFRRKENILRLEKGDLALGGDVGIAAGPEGRNSSANTNINFEAEIYSYSRSKGLYVGISLEGTVLKANKKLNATYYEKDDILMNDVFYQLKTPYTSEIQTFLASVESATF